MGNQQTTVGVIQNWVLKRQCKCANSGDSCSKPRYQNYRYYIRVLSCNTCHNDLRKIIWSCLRNRAGAIQGLQSRTIGQLVTMKNICRVQSTYHKGPTLAVNYRLWVMHEVCAPPARENGKHWLQPTLTVDVSRSGLKLTNLFTAYRYITNSGFGSTVS